MKLFITGFLQVFFVSLNTYFIANRMLVGTIISGFFINLIWTFNVKKVAFGNNTDRVVYALGASTGSFSGLLLAMYIF